MWHKEALVGVLVVALLNAGTDATGLGTTGGVGGGGFGSAGLGATGGVGGGGFGSADLGTTGMGATGFGTGLGSTGLGAGGMGATGMDTTGMGMGTGGSTFGTGMDTGVGVGGLGATTGAGLGVAGVVAAPAPVVSAGTVDPAKGEPIFIKPGQTYRLVWKTSPPHPDVIMCCGGSLQMTWSQMDGGMDRSVVLNVDDSCPGTVVNQQYVQNVAQSSAKGNVLVSYGQNGDYYLSDRTHCTGGMQFLLAVRGCAVDNSVYTPVKPLSQQALAGCFPAAPAATATPNTTTNMLAAQQAAAAAAAAAAPAGAAGVKLAGLLLAAAAGAAAALMAL